MVIKEISFNKGKKLKMTWAEMFFDILHHIPCLPGIYMITSLLTGRKYIGSSVNMSNRAMSYMKGHDTNYLKILFYGLSPETIKIEVLEIAKGCPKKDLLELELKWVNKMKTYYPLGLNHKNPVTNKPYMTGIEVKAMRFIRDNTGYNLLDFVNKNKLKYKRQFKKSA